MKDWEDPRYERENRRSRMARDQRFLVTRYPDTRLFLDRNSLDLVEWNLVLSAVIELGCPRRFVVSDLLSNFEFAAVLQIGEHFKVGATPYWVWNFTN
jgi:hypothetical protein